MPLTSLRKYSRLTVLAAAFAAAAVLLSIGALQNGTSIRFEATVNVDCKVDGVTVNIQLPGPEAYTYYYYYYYYGVAAPIKVKVIVAAEKLDTAPLLAKTEILELEAYGSNNTAIVDIPLPPGTYRVKVMFWNDLLSSLYSLSGTWHSYADPYYTTCNVG